MPASPVRRLAPVLAATAALALLVPGAASAVASSPAPVRAVTAGDRGGHGGGDDGDGPLLRSGLVGSTTPADGGPLLFGVRPGGAPWVLDSGTVRVERSGRLELRVRGLVIPTPPANGTNPVPTLSASLVCNGVLVDTTDAVPFDTEGDARIRTRVAVPETCLAPAVLVHPNLTTAVYIAANG